MVCLFFLFEFFVVAIFAAFSFCRTHKNAKLLRALTTQTPCYDKRSASISMYYYVGTRLTAHKISVLLIQEKVKWLIHIYSFARSTNRIIDITNRQDDIGKKNTNQMKLVDNDNDAGMYAELDGCVLCINRSMCVTIVCCC